MKNAMRHSSSVETLRKPDGQAALQIQGTRKMKERNGQKNRGPEKQGARKTEGQKNRASAECGYGPHPVSEEYRR
jgi:hypothetical protein